MNLNDLEHDILAALQTLNRLRLRATSYEIAAEIDKSARWTRYYLRRLESAGLVHRPAGPRSGWVAV